MKPGGAAFLADIREAETILNCIGVLICPDLFALGTRAINILNKEKRVKQWHDNALLWPSFFSGLEVISN
jgi:hypothetical protein